MAKTKTKRRRASKKHSDLIPILGIGLLAWLLFKPKEESQKQQQEFLTYKAKPGEFNVNPGV